MKRTTELSGTFNTMLAVPVEAMLPDPIGDK